MTTWLEKPGAGALLPDPASVEGATRAAGPINFNFVYKGMAFRARCAETAEGSRLEMIGTIGILPYSAQSLSARRNLLAIVEAANRTLGTAFTVSRTSRLEMHCTGPVDGAVNVANLIVAAARMLVPALPYIECMAAYLHQPATARPIASAR